MKKHTVDAKQLRHILISLTLLTAAVITLDSLPVNRTPADTEATDVLADTQPPDTAHFPDMSTDSGSDTNTETAPPDTSAPETDPPAPEPGMSVTILGSCAPGSPLGTAAYGSLNAAVRTEGPAYFLKNLQHILSKDDLTLAANACIFTDSDSMSYTCAAPTSNADIYANGSVEMTALGSPVFVGDALTGTQTALDERKITSLTQGETEYYEKDDIRLAIYCTTLSKAGDITADLAAIRTAAANAHYVLVYYWGVDTISDIPEQWLKYNLHQFADAGASLIVGTGCGVLRPTEMYGSTTIVYSLGNIVDGMSYSTSSPSALLTLRLTPESGGPRADISLVPCYYPDKRWQPTEIPAGDTRDSVSAFLAGSGELPLVNQ